MNQGERAPAGPVELARTKDFTLGACRVHPARCEVVLDDDVHELQPRIMQVLVALHEAAGHTVSRDELIARCWRGAAVSDDALTRCIAALRRLADALDARGFSIVTVPRVGYRLEPAVDEDAGVVRARALAASAMPVAAGPLRFTLAIVLLVVLAAAAWLSVPGAGPAPVRTVLHSNEADAEAEIAVVDGEHFAPAFSDNGRIAFFTNAEGERWLWACELGRAPRRILRVEDGREIGWARDNRHVAFSREGGGFGIVDVDTGQLSLLPWSRGETGPPAWAPDGRSLLFAAYGAQGWRLWRLTLDGRASAFGPDGYWAVRRGGGSLYAAHARRPGIWRLAANGAPRERIEGSFAAGHRPGLGAGFRHGFAVTGDRLYFTARAAPGEPAESGIFAVPLGGGPARLAARYPGGRPGLAVSPSGEIVTIENRPAGVAAPPPPEGG